MTPTPSGLRKYRLTLFGFFSMMAVVFFILLMAIIAEPNWTPSEIMPLLAEPLGAATIILGAGMGFNVWEKYANNGGKK